jgi:hypothetical protein
VRGSFHYGSGIPVHVIDWRTALEPPIGAHKPEHRFPSVNGSDQSKNVVYDGFGFTGSKLESRKPEVAAMDEREYPPFAEPPADHARAHASIVAIGDMIDLKRRVERENILAIRKFSSMHAFIYGEDLGIQAGETLFQKALSRLDISSSYHRFRW